MDRKIIGQNIKYYRTINAFKQGFLASKLGITTSYLSKLESGNAPIKADLLNKISDILNVNIALFFSHNSHNIKQEQIKAKSKAKVIKKHGPSDVLFKKLMLTISQSEEIELSDEDIKTLFNEINPVLLRVIRSYK